MDRLRDLRDAPDPVSRRAAELLGAARPLEASPAAEARVRARLLEGERGRIRKIALRPAVAVGLLLFAAAAAASVTWVAVRLSREAPKPEAPTGDAAGALGRTRHGGGSGAGEVAPPAVHPAPALRAALSRAPLGEPAVVDPSFWVVWPASSVFSPQGAGALPARRAALAAAKAAVRRDEPDERDDEAAAPAPAPAPEPALAPSQTEAPPPDEPPTPSATPSEASVEEAAAAPGTSISGTDAPRDLQAGHDEEGAMMLRAVRAIRRDKDLRQGAQVLEELLRTYPNGAMAEEALGLVIETASALGQSRAASLALLYLNRYPNGRFRAAAMSARARFGRQGKPTEQ